MQVQIEVLGPTAASVDGVPVGLGGKQPRALLAALVAAGDSGASNDWLVEALWGERPPATARKSIQKYVSGLRSTLGDQAIETIADGYRLADRPTRTDVDRFAELLELAASATASGDHGTSLALLDEAVELGTKGEPFADLASTGAAAAEVVAMRESITAAVERRVDALLALGRDQEAVTAAEALTTAEPLRESAWGQLMLGLYRSGRQSDALRAFATVRRTLAEELGIEPSRRLQDLEQRILLQAGDLDLAKVTTSHLPAAYTSFVGRSQELDDLRALLAEHRLVTITGAGGSGKTRLAVETAAALGAEAWFADLAQVEDPGQVAAVVAAAMGSVLEAGGDATTALASALADRHGLLILDNCEHVLGDAAAVAHAVLRAGRGLSILTTSRQPLGLTGEVVVALHPLPVPPDELSTEMEAGRFDSVRLFAERAAAAAPGFELVPNLADVAATCRALDGMPLAIELAARQLAAFDLSEIRSDLIGRLDALTAPGDPIERHRTLETAIDWSYQLLPEATRAFFASLSVFSGTFSRGAAGRVWRDVGVDDDADEHLRRLTEHSMVLRLRRTSGSRFRLLEPIRAFATSRATDRWPDASLGRAHATWVLDLLSERPDIIGPGEIEALAALRAEEHHFPAALAWATSNDPSLALRLVIAATPYLWMATYRFAWSDELRAAIDTGGDVPADLRANAMAHAGNALAENFADHATAAAYATEALEYARSHGDETMELQALLGMANAVRNIGRLDESVVLLRQAIPLADRLGEHMWSMQARRKLAFTEMQRGNYDTALQLVDVASEMAQGFGSDWVAAKSYWLEAAVLALNGDYEAAEQRASRSLELFAGFADDASPIHAQAVQGDAARLSGHPQRALAIYEECLRRFVSVGDRRCTASTLRNLGLTKLELGNPGAARRHLRAALERRAAFGDEAGVAECLEGLGRVALAMASPIAAAELLSAASVLRTRSGSQPPKPELAAAEAALTAALAAGGLHHSEVRSRGETLANSEDLVAAVDDLEHAG